MEQVHCGYFWISCISLCRSQHTHTHTQIFWVVLHRLICVCDLQIHSNVTVDAGEADRPPDCILHIFLDIFDIFFLIIIMVTLAEWRLKMSQNVVWMLWENWTHPVDQSQTFCSDFLSSVIVSATLTSWSRPPPQSLHLCAAAKSYGWRCRNRTEHSFLGRLAGCFPPGKWRNHLGICFVDTRQQERDFSDGEGRAAFATQGLLRLCFFSISSTSNLLGESTLKWFSPRLDFLFHIKIKTNIYSWGFKKNARRFRNRCQRNLTVSSPWIKTLKRMHPPPEPEGFHKDT